MGVSFSCPFANLDDLDAQFESYLVRQISFEGEDVRTIVRSLSFDAIDSKSTTMKKSHGSGKMILEGSLSFNGRGLETKISLRTPEKKTVVRSDSISRKKVVPLKSPLSSGCSFEKTSPLPLPESGSNSEKTSTSPLPQSGSFSEITSPKPLPQSGHHRNLAAVRLQKTYKSFRTRRQLADCAVLAEQRWWKVLDFAELKRTSVSFFDIEKPETAISRWSRAKCRAAKVGKGLSKAEKARKLALQHWLEAIDPRHRYGHNLQFYYVKWLQCESRQPFFYWLDIGEGKEVNLEKCGRYKLQQQCIKYLGPIERKGYEVAIEDGKFLYKESGQLLDTRSGPEDVKWIFVLSVSMILYVGQKKKGTFQHSSFLAGGATLSAGRLVVEDGILKAVWPHSGHYLPTEENFEELMLYLKQHNVDLSIVQRAPTGEEEEEAIFKKTSGISIHNGKSESDLSRASKDKDDKIKNSKDAESAQPSISGKLRKLGSKISLLQIPSREDIIQLFMKGEKKQQQPRTAKRRHKRVCSLDNRYSSDGYETAEEYLSDSDDQFSFSKRNLFDEDEEKYLEETIIPKEKIMKRIKSHKSMQSLQLANQLSCRWTTGAGPRIGCMRDYPSELQFRVLEEAHLSPRSSSAKRSHNSLIPSDFKKETLGKSPLSS